ncbi:MAG: sugar transferase [Bacteroidota bacterium]|nr:sugar transferase [Bacteroidota bacterium]MDP4232703.1 sugar transferase [Bacteroidota bacterium]MDP4243164.1 sugar transferase [Bacteroidota bacterium]MDP4287621.1 sugar transferase [Bacteroidota bacterium]
MIFETAIRRHGWPKISLVLLDFVAVTLAAVTTLLLHYFAGFDSYDVEHSLGEYILRVAILYASFPLLVLIFRQHLLYKYKVYSTGVSQFAQLARALLINALLLIAVLFFLREDWIQHSRTNLFLFTVSSLVLLSFFRIVLYRKLLLPAITGIEARRILLVGAGEEARALLAESTSGRIHPFEIVAMVDQGGSLSQDSSAALLLTTVPLLKEFVLKYNIHEVVVAENDLPYEDVVRLIGEARETGVPIHLLSDHFKVIHERVTKSTSEFLNVTAAPISHGLHGFYSTSLKRFVDLVGTIIGLVLLSPFLAIIVVAIKLGSRGPIFFSTEVIGQHGERFRWFKFRTMQLGPSDELHREHVAQHIQLGTRPTGKLENDPRITPIGRWLRRHSLDELPQLYNVLRGDMSLVGPRPCLPYEFEQYAAWHKERFAVRPGMTGLWQVSGRSSVSFNDMVILDLYYIHNISLWLDAAIILRTVGVVLTGKGGG